MSEIPLWRRRRGHSMVGRWVKALRGHSMIKRWALPRGMLVLVQTAEETALPLRTFVGP